MKLLERIKSVFSPAPSKIEMAQETMATHMAKNNLRKAIQSVHQASKHLSQRPPIPSTAE